MCVFLLCMLSQSCQTLCDPLDCSPPGSSVHGIFQARVLEWSAITFSWPAQSLQSRPTLCDPHRRQATSLPRPWDSPGKNTGVGCHFLLQCMKVKSESEFAQLCPTLSDPMDCSLLGCSIHGIFQANLDSILKNGDITLPTKVHLVKAMVFPVVMYGCDTWTVKKSEH